MRPNALLQLFQNTRFFRRQVEVVWDSYLESRNLHLVRAIIDVLKATRVSERAFTVANVSTTVNLCSEDEGRTYLSVCEICFFNAAPLPSSMSGLALAARSFRPTSPGVHQYTGYCLSVLLKMQATAVIKTLPSSTSGMNIQPNAIISAFVLARTAVAPPGGWTVFVALMTKLAHAHPTAPATHS